MKHTMRWIGRGLLAVVVVGLVVLGGWRAGWWFKEQNVERQAHIFRKSYANQERLREDISEKLGAVLETEATIAQLDPRRDASEIEALEAQARGTMNIACHDAEQISGDELPPEQASYISARCELGSVVPNP